VVGDHDIIKALLLAFLEIDILFVANIDAVVVSSLYNLMDVNL
jgi:hypothetical protein